MEFNKLTNREEYTKAFKKNKNAYKHGQLKLYTMELLFLKNIKYDYDLVYAGSTPGYHIPPLIKKLENPPKKLFLIDDRPSEFESAEDVIIIQKKIGNKTNKEFISYSDVKKLTNNKIVLISDIRTIPENEVTPELKIADYKIQEQMLKKLKPEDASLKFAYPFPNLTKELPDTKLTIDISKLYIQPFTPIHSTELRYFYNKNDKEIITLNNKQAKEFEEKMAYYNRYIRDDYKLFENLLPEENIHDILSDIQTVINNCRNPNFPKVKKIKYPTKKEKLITKDKILKKIKITL